MSYTVTEKGTVTIPVEIRKKYMLKKGSKVKFVDTENGALIVPAPSFEELKGIFSKQVAREIIRELQKERKQEAARDES